MPDSPNQHIERQFIGFMITRLALFVNMSNLFYSEPWHLVLYNAATIEADSRKVKSGNGDCLVGKTILDCLTSTTEFVFRLPGGITSYGSSRGGVLRSRGDRKLYGLNGEIVVWN